jgi:hypothetical protein
MLIGWGCLLRGPKLAHRSLFHGTSTSPNVKRALLLASAFNQASGFTSYIHKYVFIKGRVTHCIQPSYRNPISNAPLPIYRLVKSHEPSHLQ